MTDVAETARKALEILDRDGWCKGHFTCTYSIHFYRAGSHCLAGAWTLALGSDCYRLGEESYKPVAELIRAMFPAARCPHIVLGALRSFTSEIACWNDHAATEDDVRAVLEKLAAGC